MYVFIKGLEQQRLEIHGSYASLAVANLLAHLQYFDDSEGFELMVEDIERSGTPTEKYQWATISVEYRRRIEEESTRVAGLCKEAYADCVRHGRFRPQHHSDGLDRMQGYEGDIQ